MKLKFRYRYRIRKIRRNFITSEKKGGVIELTKQECDEQYRENEREDREKKKRPGDEELAK